MSSLIDHNISKADLESIIFNKIIFNSFLDTEPEEPEPEPEQESFEELEIEPILPPKDLRVKLAQLSYLQQKFISEANINDHLKILANIEATIGCLSEADIQARKMINSEIKIQLICQNNPLNMEKIVNLKKFVRSTGGHVDSDEAEKDFVRIKVNYQEGIYFQIFKEVCQFFEEVSTTQIYSFDLGEMSLENIQQLFSILPKTKNVQVMAQNSYLLDLEVVFKMLEKIEVSELKGRLAIEFFEINFPEDLEKSSLEKRVESIFSSDIHTEILIQNNKIKIDLSKKEAKSKSRCLKKRPNIKIEYVKSLRASEQKKIVNSLIKYLAKLILILIWMFIIISCFNYTEHLKLLNQDIFSLSEHENNSSHALKTLSNIEYFELFLSNQCEAMHNYFQYIE